MSYVTAAYLSVFNSNKDRGVQTSYKHWKTDILILHKVFSASLNLHLVACIYIYTAGYNYKVSQCYAAAVIHLFSWQRTNGTDCFRMPGSITDDLLSYVEHWWTMMSTIHASNGEIDIKNGNTYDGFIMDL